MQSQYLNITAKIIDMYMSGVSMDEIAISVSETPYYVNSILLKNYLYIHRYGSADNQFRRLYESGKTVEEICDDLNITLTEAKQYRDAYIISLYRTPLGDPLMSCEEIADMLKCPLDEIVDIVRKVDWEVPRIYRTPKIETVEDKLDKLIAIMSKLLDK